MSFIKIIAFGNLTRDPELRVLPTGTAICQFGIAASKKWKDTGGQDREDTCFVDVEAWGKTAENITKYFKKGSPIFVEGSLKLDQWEDKTDGKKRSKHKVVADRFEFVGGGKKDESAPAQDRNNADFNGAPPQRPAQSTQDISEDVPF
jgi:single-strand DNA-binding protein